MRLLIVGVSAICFGLLLALQQTSEAFPTDSLLILTSAQAEASPLTWREAPPLSPSAARARPRATIRTAGALDQPA